MKYNIVELYNNLYLIRFNDRDIKFFEGIWEIPEGITYNSYLYLGDKNILFDTVKKEYSSYYLEAIKEIIDPKNIDMLVMHHVEPDHSGAIPALLEASNHKIQIRGHPMALKILNGMYPTMKFKFRPVTDGEELVIGKDKFRFIYTPWLHWPETMMTYIETDKILLTCDAFGGYSIPDSVTDENSIQGYEKYMKKYLVTVIGNYREWIIKNINKLKKLNVSPYAILPSHGLVWVKNPSRVVDYYLKLASMEMSNKIFILYTTMYGSSKDIAIYIEKKLRDMGFETYLDGFDDTHHPAISDLLSEAYDSVGYIFITPTYESGIHPLMKNMLYNILSKIKVSKPSLIISPYGWGGIASKEVSKILREKGYKKIYSIDIRDSIKANEKNLLSILKEFVGDLK